MNDLQLTKGWTTHIPILVKLIMQPDFKGDVVEFGGGPSSTPLLHWLCKEKGVKLISYENEPSYYEFEKQFQSKDHSVRFVEDWNKIEIKNKIGLLFIDHHPYEQRSIDAIRFKDKANYVVLHDTEKPDKYGYNKVWQHFLYKHTWKKCKPWTSVLSNYKDVLWLQK